MKTEPATELADTSAIKDLKDAVTSLTGLYDILVAAKSGEARQLKAEAAAKMLEDIQGVTSAANILYERLTNIDTAGWDDMAEAVTKARGAETSATTAATVAKDAIKTSYEALEQAKVAVAVSTDADTLVVEAT